MNNPLLEALGQTPRKRKSRDYADIPALDMPSLHMVSAGGTPSMRTPSMRMTSFGGMPTQRMVGFGQGLPVNNWSGLMLEGLPMGNW